MEQDTESVVVSVKRLLSQIDNMLADDADDWESYLPGAQSAISSLDRINFIRIPDRLPEQRWIVQILQDYAYHDSDEGAVRDIAEWCQAAWLRILRDHPGDFAALTGKLPKTPKLLNSSYMRDFLDPSRPKGFQIRLLCSFGQNWKILLTSMLGVSSHAVWSYDEQKSY
jgi:hypothetical protein